MPVCVHIPIRLRLDVSEVAVREDCVVNALSAAVGRALEHSHRAVLARRAGYLGVHLATPAITWRGDALDQATPQQRERLAGLVQEVLAGLVSRSAVAGNAAAQSALERPLAAPAVERFEPRRSDGGGGYRFPSYQEAGAETSAPIDGVPAGDTPAAPTTRLAGRWRPRAVNWWRNIDPDQLLEDEESAFAYWAMPYQPEGKLGAIWEQPDPQYPLALYVRNLADGASAWYTLGLFEGSEFRRVTEGPLAGTGHFERYSYLPEAGPTIAEWWTMDQARVHIRATIENQIRAQPGAETLEAAVLDERQQQLVESELERRMAAGAGYTDVLMVDIGGAVNHFLMRADLPRWTGLVYLAPLADSRSVPVDPEAARPGGGEAEGEDAGAGAGGSGAGTGTGTGTGTGAGARGGRRDGRGSAEGPSGGGSDDGGFVFLGDDAGGTGAGQRLPSVPGGTAAPRCTAPFNGEPSLDQLPPADAERLRRLIRDIAYRLEIDPCVYAGSFCLVAAAILGGRARGVSEYAESPDHGRMLLSPRRNALGAGVIDFMPTVSPALQLLRHLADVVPRITGLSLAIQEIYQRHAHLITGPRHHHAIGWLLDFGAQLHTTLKRSVANHFVFTTSVVFMQLLHTSKNNIDARLDPRNFDAYASFFEELVRGDLMTMQQLEDLRGILVLSTGTGSTLRDVAGGVIGTWRAARGALLDIGEGRNPFAHAGEGASGSLVFGDHGITGVRDADGVIWTLPQLDRAIALRRDVAMQIDPLARQLTADPRIRERFTRDRTRIREELRTLLGEMQTANREVTQRVRDDVGYAFTLAPLDTEYTGANPQTLPGTGFVMQGVHLLAHQAVGEFFRGDLYYTFGAGSALKGEDSRRTLISMLEIGTIVMASIICAPIGLVVGAGWSAYHEVVAGHHLQAYRALIDPDRVFRYAELEAEAFAADLGALLSFIPLGRYAGRVGIGAGRRLLEGEVRAAARYAVRHVTKTLTLATLRALQNDLVLAFVTHVAAFEVIGRVMGVMLGPIIDELSREQFTLEQLMSLSAEVEPA